MYRKFIKIEIAVSIRTYFVYNCIPYLFSHVVITSLGIVKHISFTSLYALVFLGRGRYSFFVYVFTLPIKMHLKFKLQKYLIRQKI